ncbi:MAG: hypothetical protein ACKVE4_11065 [Dissulfuribacterales bacterium]
MRKIILMVLGVFFFCSAVVSAECWNLRVSNWARTSRLEKEYILYKINRQGINPGPVNFGYKDCCVAVLDTKGGVIDYYWVYGEDSFTGIEKQYARRLYGHKTPDHSGSCSRLLYGVALVGPGVDLPAYLAVPADAVLSRKDEIAKVKEKIEVLKENNKLSLNNELLKNWRRLLQEDPILIEKCRVRGRLANGLKIKNNK